MENEQMSYGDIANITELWEKQKNKTPNSAMAFSEKISKKYGFSEDDVFGLISIIEESKEEK